MCFVMCFFFVKQKTAYEMRISDWSSDVCSSDLMLLGPNMVRLVNKAEQLGLEVARAPDPAGLQHRGTGAIDLQFLNLTDLLDRPELKLDKTIVRETVRGCRVMVTGDRKSTRLNSSH